MVASVTTTSNGANNTSTVDNISDNKPIGALSHHFINDCLSISNGAAPNGTNQVTFLASSTNTLGITVASTASGVTSSPSTVAGGPTTTNSVDLPTPTVSTPTGVGSTTAHTTISITVNPSSTTKVSTTTPRGKNLLHSGIHKNAFNLY